MSQFVRICPKCQTQNPEYEHVCNSCGHFIAMESPVDVKTIQTKEETKTESPITEQATEITESSPELDVKTETPAIYLELQAADRPIFTVKSGWIMGQAYAGNPAEIQIDAAIDGCEFVHRRHCRFVYKEPHWYVQALDQKRFQGEFTNPTQVNGKTVAIDKARLIKNGDLLSLSGLSFQVKVIR